MIPGDLLEKYGVPERDAAQAVEAAVAQVLSGAFGMDIMVRLDSPLEILACTREGASDRPPVRIDPATLSRQLQRQVRYHVERELEKRQALREWEILRELRGKAIPGEIIRIRSDGALAVILGVEETFRTLLLAGECPLRAQPPRERALYRVGDTRRFLVTSVLPVEVRGKARVQVLLSRSTMALPEVLLRERAGEARIRCRRRIAGAFTEIEASARISKEAIAAVSRELEERIKVRVLAS